MKRKRFARRPDPSGGRRDAAVEFLDEVLGELKLETSALAGFLQLPFSLLVIGGSIIGSRLVNHFGTRPAMACGLLTVGIAQIVMTGISVASGGVVCGCRSPLYPA